MKGYALLIGVNQVDNFHYTDPRILCSSLKDTENIEYAIENWANYDYVKRLNYCCTYWENVTKHITDLVRLTNENKEESYVFIYFSGHGSSITAKGHREKQQFLCFYDKMILENQIQEQISQFNERSKLFVLIDSCYSEGIGHPNVITIPYIKGRKSLDQDLAQKIFDDNPSYQATVDDYATKKFRSESEICYLFACSEIGTTIGGFGCAQSSEFTTDFQHAWETIVRQNHHHFNNYYSLYHYVRSSPGNEARMVFPSHKRSGFFMKFYPLILKQSNMVSPIKLNETHLSGYVEFDLDQQSAGRYSMNYSTTLTIDSNNSTHLALVAKIELFNDPGEDLMKDVKYISLIFIEPVIGGGNSNLPELIRGLRTDPKEHYGIVITVGNDLELLHKPKRTSGRVSNKLG